MRLSRRHQETRVAPTWLVGATILIVACGGAPPEPAADVEPPPAAESAVADTAPPEPITPWCGEAACPCQEGTEDTHYQKDTLAKCILAVATTIQGRPCKAERQVTFSQEGTLTSCVLADAVTLGPYTCSGGKIAHFFSDGRLKDCYLAETTEIAGLPCKDGTSFRADGSLRRCRLEEDREFDGFPLQAKDWITLGEGRLYRWEMSAGPRAVGDLVCKGGFNYFHPNGQVAKCKLAEPATLEGQSYDAEATVCFDESGAVADCSTMRFRAT